VCLCLHVFVFVYVSVYIYTYVYTYIHAGSKNVFRNRRSNDLSWSKILEWNLNTLRLNVIINPPLQSLVNLTLKHLNGSCRNRKIWEARLPCQNLGIFLRCFELNRVRSIWWDYLIYSKIAWNSKQISFEEICFEKNCLFERFSSDFFVVYFWSQKYVLRPALDISISLYKYIYTYIYVCDCTGIYTYHIYTYIYIYVFIYINVNKYRYVYTHISCRFNYICINV